VHVEHFHEFHTTGEPDAGDREVETYPSPSSLPSLPSLPLRSASAGRGPSADEVITSPLSFTTAVENGGVMPTQRGGGATRLATREIRGSWANYFRIGD